MNRKPQEADCFNRVKGADCMDPKCGYHTHIRTCGGEYLKTKEPEPPKKQAKGKTKGRGDVVLTNNNAGLSQDDGKRSLRELFDNAASAGPGSQSGAADSARKADGGHGSAAAAAAKPAGKRARISELLAGPSSKKRALDAQAPADAAQQRINDLMSPAKPSHKRQRDADTRPDAAPSKRAAIAGHTPDDVICLDSDADDDAQQPSPAAGVQSGLHQGTATDAKPAEPHSTAGNAQHGAQQHNRTELQQQPDNADEGPGSRQNMRELCAAAAMRRLAIVGAAD